MSARDHVARWAAEEPALAYLTEALNACQSLAFTADGARLVFLCEDAIFVEHLGGRAGRSAPRPLAPGRVGLRLLPEADLALTVDPLDARLVMVDLEMGQTTRRLAATGAAIWSFDRAPDTRTMVIGEYQTLATFDATHGRLIHRWRALERVIPAVTVAPDGERCAARDFDEAGIWELATGRQLVALAELDGPGCGVVFSPDGRWLASGLNKTAAALWSATDGRRARTLEPTTGFTLCAAFSPDGLVLATGGQDEQVRLWEVASGRPLAVLPGPGGWVKAVGFSPNGRMLAALGHDGFRQVWGATPLVRPPHPVQPATHRVGRIVAGVRPTIETAAITDLASFLGQLDHIPWFAHLGQPSPWDDGCRRHWDEWFGPEDSRSEAPHHLYGEWERDLRVAVKEHGLDSIEHQQRRTEAVVRGRAAACVAYDETEDAWYAPNACVWEAGVLAGLMAGYLALHWVLPADMRLLWSWFAAGYWPCGAEETGDGRWRLIVL